MKNHDNIDVIRIELDDSYVIKPSEDQHYDIWMNFDHYDWRSSFHKYFHVKVNSLYTFALIATGDKWYYDNEKAILHGSCLTILQGWRIIQVDIHTGKMINVVTLDVLGSIIDMFEVNDNYLIYGEVYIVMLDASLHELWTFMGRDIFISMTGKKSFELKNDSICLYDFVDNYYELDYEGNQILFIPCQ